jgi:hypothetical protein
MWYRDAALVEDRIARFTDEARVARLQAEARANCPRRPHRARVLAAAAVRGVGRAAVNAAHWTDARTADREASNMNDIAWHRS